MVVGISCHPTEEILQTSKTALHCINFLPPTGRYGFSFQRRVSASIPVKVFLPQVLSSKLFVILSYTGDANTHTQHTANKMMFNRWYLSLIVNMICLYSSDHLFVIAYT